MKAMILAAGRGQRMGNLTEETPKPLLAVDGKPLIEHHLEALSRAGIKDVVINVAYLADKIEAALGGGSRWGLRVHYSCERSGALGTGGGIRQALPLLGDEPFIVLSADVRSDFPLKKLPKSLDGLAHLILVDDPQKESKDFDLDSDGLCCLPEESSGYIFSGIAVIDPRLFVGRDAGDFSIGPLFKAALANRLLSGEVYTGYYRNVNTPEGLV